MGANRIQHAFRDDLISSSKAIHDLLTEKLDKELNRVETEMQIGFQKSMQVKADEISGRLFGKCETKIDQLIKSKLQGVYNALEADFEKRYRALENVTTQAFELMEKMLRTIEAMPTPQVLIPPDAIQVNVEVEQPEIVVQPTPPRTKQITYDSSGRPVSITESDA